MIPNGPGQPRSARERGAVAALLHRHDTAPSSSAISREPSVEPLSADHDSTGSINAETSRIDAMSASRMRHISVDRAPPQSTERRRPTDSAPRGAGRGGSRARASGVASFGSSSTTSPVEGPASLLKSLGGAALAAIPSSRHVYPSPESERVVAAHGRQAHRGPCGRDPAPAIGMTAAQAEPRHRSGTGKRSPVNAQRSRAESMAVRRTLASTLEP